MAHEDGDDDWIFDPSMAALNRSIERDIREEAAEVENVVAESELRARSFADVALEMRNRGEMIAVATSQKIFSGQIAYAAGDFITVITDGIERIEVDINLADVAYMRVVEKGRKGAGKPAFEGPGTFEMRLLERRSSTDVVEVGFRPLKDTALGRIIAVGQDHIVLADASNHEWAVPIEAIAYVIRQKRRSLR